MEHSDFQNMSDWELYRFLVSSEWVDWDGLDEAEYRTGVHCGTGFDDATVGEVYEALRRKATQNGPEKGPMR